MAGRQRVVRVRRNYNQWVANQTLEDYALRFTAKSARRWSSLRVANTALGAISFLALEAIGGAITLNYGFTNAALAIMVVGLIIFATGLPISYYAAKYGVDIDLLTRGAGFGYIGSTVTSLIYASFTFIFFAIEASIMSMVLEMCFGVPVWLGYILSSVVVIPLVTHGITFISRFQLWTQPIWIILHLAPFAVIAVKEWPTFHHWMQYAGHAEGMLAARSEGGGFNLIAFGAAGSVVFSLIAQIGEQVDFLRFLPRERRGRRFAWWLSLLSAGPGWIIPGGLKLLAGSFLAYLALQHGVPFDKAAEPTQMYLIAFQYLVSSPELSLALTGLFVVISQIKINVTNAYAGSIAWSNFFSRLTHSHPGRVVWLVFNVIIALLLMELGIYKALEQILGLYSTVAVAWVGALVADLVVTKPLKLSPPHIEFKRAHLYDINPVGVGAMTIATVVSVTAFCGLLGDTLQAFAPFLALVVAFVAAPLIAIATKGRYYTAREPRANWAGEPAIRCCICEHKFEPEDMAFCPAYAGPICSLCCSLDARCHDSCKTEAKFADQILTFLGKALPERIVAGLNSRVGHYLGVMFLLAWVIGGVLVMIYFQATMATGATSTIGSTLWAVFCILMIVAGVAGWLFVLAQESRKVAQEESQRQTTLLMREIQAHKRTDAKLHAAKEAAEAANLAKSRYIVGVSHELRTPLNAILGYAQLLERDNAIPPRRRDGIRVIRRSSEHLSGLIDGLLDISKIEAGRLHLYRDEVHIHELIEQLVDMFDLHAAAKGIKFVSTLPETLPAVVYTDEKRLRQILINLLSNAIKFTDTGEVALRLRYRSQVAEFEIEDTGVGIRAEDLERIFEPFERAASAAGQARPGTGLGLTITKLLTEIMGGQISVISEPGKGSLFRVKLLLSEVVEPERPAAAEKRIRGYSGRRLTVLVIDDDADHRDLVYDILSPLGFNLFSAPDGSGGLSLAELCEPDLILLDISLPDMRGWDVARSLRQSGHEQTAIMMVSANALDSARERNSEELYDDYLSKPIDIQRFLDRIQVLLEIDWVHDSAELDPEPVFFAAPVLSQAALAEGTNLPARRHLDELHQLGRIGYVRGIEAKLDVIEQENDEHAAFVGHLRGLVRNFDLRSYMDALEGLRTHDS